MQAEGENEVNNELANRISLFYADATPMLKTLSDGTTKFVSEVRNDSLPVKNEQHRSNCPVNKIWEGQNGTKAFSISTEQELAY